MVQVWLLTLIVFHSTALMCRFHANTAAVYCNEFVSYPFCLPAVLALSQQLACALPTAGRASGV